MSQNNDLIWPANRHVAVVVNVAYEAWSDGKGPAIGPMGNPLPQGSVDTNAMSWGRYGEVTGIKRLLSVLKRTGARANVMVSGILAQRQPELVRRISDDGHEIIAHSFAQDVVPASLSEQDDLLNVRKTTDLLRSVTGSSPVGWISPRGTPGELTVRHLIDAGYSWYGDEMERDEPSLKKVGDRSIISIPFTMDVNDLPHAVRFGRTPEQFVRMFEVYLEHTAEVNDGPIIIDVTAHAHCYGRPGGAWAFEQVIKTAVDNPNVWLTTRGQIAAHYENWLKVRS